MNNEPVAYINVEERKLEWAKPMTWNTPTIAKMDKIPLYTKPNDEPAAWFYYRLGESGKFMCADAEAMKGIEKDGWVTTPLYLHPVNPKYDPETGEPLIDGYPLFSGLPRIVKELTDEEIIEFIESWEGLVVTKRTIEMLRAILRKAQEK